ncbi:branched-chain amino acid ABC transporter permease [Bradyrhizobium sp. CCGB12]|uniref:branched-chain amino acid ABC transporter permease n=1 Tax=Bradyrhizobium sp. CCGB12 TaxID=2949632 RepID=UPI0020B1A94D|nr:branched-chain amino acid ABC transporter permease [Bradyrhizobium sp. CCGB12]MCP3387839.1 branched-chain amino acid ABC transporter permease [Bradyrhizobium sp. CCGB12]
MEFYAISLLNGLVYGLLLFTVSAGLTLVFGMMGILNLAHASFYMIGAYVGYVCASRLNFWIGLLVAPVFVGVLAAFIERTMLRRVHSAGHGQELVFTLGLAYVIEECVKVLFGDYPVDYGVPSYLKFSAFTVFDTSFPFYRLFIALAAVGMFLVIWLTLVKTKVGLVVRAAERLPVMTAALGHDVDTTFTAVFAAGAALAGIAGAIGGAYYPTSPSMALNFGVIVFVVVVVGGLGSVLGSFIAAILIGVLTSFVIGVDLSFASVCVRLGCGLDPAGGKGILSTPVSSFAGAVPFILMIVVLLVRPSGLMGERN